MSDITDFTVEGRGLFPLDMLRHDECWPVETEQALMLGEDISRRAVKLRTNSSRNIHPKRWDSFNWKVTRIDSERFGDMTDEMLV